MSKFIPLEQAITMTTAYRHHKDEILKDTFLGKDLLALCETFDKDQILTILSKPECASLRIYYGMDDAMKVHAVIVGANAQGEDILPVTEGIEGDNDTIIEESTRCPPDCPPDSPLNTP